MESAQKSIFTLQFYLLCTSSFLFFASFNMLIPELPDYLAQMGGGAYKGFIISLFTVTAGLSRPFSGRLTDRVGRVPVMAFGSLVCFVCGFLYPICTTVLPFLFLRLAHGFSTGFKPTGTSAYIADIIPADRRGEAMGLHGLYSSIGMALGPAMGSWIAEAFSLNVLFYISSIFALLSIAILVNMKETLPKTQTLNREMFQITRKDIFDTDVLQPSVVTFLTAFSFGAVATLTPDLSKSVGLQNKGLFFLIYTLASLAVRLFAGKFSDRHGRVPIIKVGCANLIVAMGITALANNQALFFVGAAFFGIAMGILSPICLAWTVDLSNDANRGRALATMYITMEAGIGLGAFLSALIYGDNATNFVWAFGMSGVLAIFAFGYLYTIRDQRTAE